MVTDSEASSRRPIWPWLIVVMLIVIGMWSTTPQPATDAGPDDFGADRAMAHIRAIAVEPHPMGTAANARVREYIVDQLLDLGIEVDRQTTTVPDYFGNLQPVDIVNIIARIPGTTGERAVALIGHYDTVPTTPGANDNTAAVAAIIETARALVTGPPLQNDILLIFTDAEEPAPRHAGRRIESGAATEIGIACHRLVTHSS